MESLDLRVLSDVLAWRQAGHRVTLVTVVETWGSAPRPPGALLTDGGDPLEGRCARRYSDYSGSLLKCVSSAPNAKNPARLSSESGDNLFSVLLVDAL